MMRTVQEVHAEIEAEHMSAIEGAQAVVEKNDEVVESYTKIPDEAIPALAEVEEATGANVARMIDLKNEVNFTQAAIDAMHGKSLEIIIHKRTIISQESQGAAGYAGNIDDILPPPNQAGGFSGVVNSPMYMRVGEAGPERVNVQPITNHNYDININTAATSGTYQQDIMLAQAMAQ